MMVQWMAAPRARLRCHVFGDRAIHPDFSIPSLLGILAFSDSLPLSITRFPTPWV